MWRCCLGRHWTRVCCMTVCYMEWYCILSYFVVNCSMECCWIGGGIGGWWCMHVEWKTSVQIFAVWQAEAVTLLTIFISIVMIVWVKYRISYYSSKIKNDMEQNFIQAAWTWAPIDIVQIFIWMFFSHGNFLGWGWLKLWDGKLESECMVSRHGIQIEKSEISDGRKYHLIFVRLNWNQMQCCRSCVCH